MEGVTRVTTQTFRQMKAERIPITVLTAYDYSMARILDRAGVDALLVGDSASNVMAGHETTLPITLDQMIYHAQCVVRAVERAFVIVDLPFGTYQGNSQQALVSAIRVMKESGAHAVKIEGGQSVLSSIKIIHQTGIPIMGHLGLTPQSIYRFGTYKVRAQDPEEADQIREDALDLQKAGCCAIVIEKIPARLASEISSSLTIPTIGIGAGNGCDGQVLVTHDALGLNNDFHPRFVRRYINLEESMSTAVKSYVDDVRNRLFPSNNESY